MALWSVRLDADAGGYDEAIDAALREALADYSPAVGAGHIAGHAVDGRITVQLAVEARSMHRAAEKARLEVTAVLRAHHRRPRLVRLEVLPWQEFEAELPAPIEVMSIHEIARLFGVTRQRAHQLVRRDDFPQPLGRPASGSVWNGAAVRRWLATWPRRQGPPVRNR